MVFDTFDNFGKYTSLHPQFKDVEAFIKNTNLLGLENGKHMLNDKGLFVSVNEYETKREADCFIECHRKYIDIQVLATGCELMGVAPVSDCTIFPYNEQKEYHKLEGEVSFIYMKPGRFVIFFPTDAHMPSVRAGEQPSEVKKIVFKVPVV